MSSFSELAVEIESPVSNKKKSIKRDPRFFDKRIRLVSWSCPSNLHRSDVAYVPSLDIPNGGPSHGLWCIQDSSNALAMTQKAFADAKKAGKDIIFHRMDIDLEAFSSGEAADPDASDLEYLRAIRLLPLDDLNNDINVVLCQQISPIVGRRYTDIKTAFREDPCGVGDALFKVLPSMGVMTWRLTSAEFSTGTVRAACLREGVPVSQMVHFIGGIGECDLNWAFEPESFVHKCKKVVNHE